MNWISIEDRNPPNDVYVLVARYHSHKSGYDGFFIQIASRMNNVWIDDHNGEIIKDKKIIVTHWMPLPDAPEKDKL